MNECTFCKIVENTISSNKIYENESLLIFPPLKEGIIAKGHMLVIPKKHYENMYDIPSEELNNVIQAIQSVAKNLKKTFHAEGINILHASGEVAQQSIFHFHMHLIPRYKDDGLDLWPNTGYNENNFLDVYNQLKKTIDF